MNNEKMLGINRRVLCLKKGFSKGPMRAHTKEGLSPAFVRVGLANIFVEQWFLVSCCNSK
jgi:hypothetical protein